MTIIEALFQSRIHNFIPFVAILKAIGFIGTIGTQIVLVLIDLEIFTKDKRLRQLFSEIRLRNIFVPIDEACYIAWFAYLQLSMGNFLCFGYTMHRGYLLYTQWMKARKPVQVPQLRDEEYVGVLKLPILDGRHSIANVSLYSMVLGLFGGLGIYYSYHTIGLFVFFITIFHELEYITTVLYQPASLDCIPR
jgi:hypothetical protein